jgi:hypothetical protein
MEPRPSRCHVKTCGVSLRSVPELNVALEALEHAFQDAPVHSD